MTSFTIRGDRRLIRATARSQRCALIQITAPPATRDRERAPVNLAFVIDRSGSMSGGKLDLAKQAVEEAVARLDPRDRFSIVVYDDVVETVIDSTPASAEARRNALAGLADVGARGSTNLGDGWLKGCEQVAAHLAPDGVNRVLLLTDGLANRGMTDPGELTRHASELRVRGVNTTTFGVGADFDEGLLQSMADAGGGHFYYIADAAQIRDHIASEVGETLEVVAREVEIGIVAGEGVAIEAISPHPLETRGSRSSIVLGDLVADQVVDVVVRFTFPYGQIGRETGVIVDISDRDRAFEAAGVRDARWSWAYADHAANDAQPHDPEVDRAVAGQFAARARQEAVRLNKAGDYAGARRALHSTAARIGTYAGRDRALRALMSELDEESHEVAAAMPAPALKAMHFASANMARCRDASGRSRKSR